MQGKAQPGRQPPWLSTISTTRRWPTCRNSSTGSSPSSARGSSLSTLTLCSRRTRPKPKKGSDRWATHRAGSRRSVTRPRGAARCPTTHLREPQGRPPQTVAGRAVHQTGHGPQPSPPPSRQRRHGTGEGRVGIDLDIVRSRKARRNVPGSLRSRLATGYRIAAHPVRRLADLLYSYDPADGDIGCGDFEKIAGPEGTRSRVGRNGKGPAATWSSTGGTRPPSSTSILISPQPSGADEELPASAKTPIPGVLDPKTLEACALLEAHFGGHHRVLADDADGKPYLKLDPPRTRTPPPRDVLHRGRGRTTVSRRFGSRRAGRRSITSRSSSCGAAPDGRARRRTEDPHSRRRSRPSLPLCSVRRKARRACGCGRTGYRHDSS